MDLARGVASGFPDTRRQWRHSTEGWLRDMERKVHVGREATLSGAGMSSHDVAVTGGDAQHRVARRRGEGPGRP